MIKTSTQKLIIFSPFKKCTILYIKKDDFFLQFSGEELTSSGCNGKNENPLFFHLSGRNLIVEMGLIIKMKLMGFNQE